MNNAILFFYGINASGIKKINNNYYFKYLNNNYGIYSYNRDILDSIYLYNLNLEVLSKGLIGYEIIVTNTKQILFTYEGKYYILMKFPNIINRIITYNDLINFNFEIENNRYEKIDKSNWGLSWSNKIDFIEYQFKQINKKYPLLENYIDYYIGIWENAICYFNNNATPSNKKYVCHKRISVNMNLYDFLNPLNFVIDYKERDIGEYLKSYVTSKNFSLSLFDNYFKNFSRESIVLLISRLLFPSYFFDMYENIVIDNNKEQEILNVISKNSNIISYLKYIFNILKDANIPYIDWIKKED